MKQICKEMRLEFLDSICRLGVIEVKNGGGIPTKHGKITTSVVVEDNREGWRDYGGEWQDVYADAEFNKLLGDLLLNGQLRIDDIESEMGQGITRDAFLGEGICSVEMVKLVRKETWWTYLVICSDTKLPNNDDTYHPHYRDVRRSTSDRLKKVLM